MGLTGLTFMVYLTLQVPPDKLNAGIAFPKLASPVEKTESIPDIKTSGASKTPKVGEVPAYALFYSTKPGEGDPSKLGAPRPRQNPKPAKRTPGAVKAKRPS
jgi:hypothetical protein